MHTGGRAVPDAADISHLGCRHWGTTECMVCLALHDWVCAAALTLHYFIPEQPHLE